jgi:hypothetical protein
VLVAAIVERRVPRYQIGPRANRAVALVGTETTPQPLGEKREDLGRLRFGAMNGDKEAENLRT